MKTILLATALLMGQYLVAQSTCDQYKDALSDYKKAGKAYQNCKTSCEEKEAVKLRDAFQSAANRAAVSLVSCTNAQKMLPHLTELLQTNNNIGNLYLDAGDYRMALLYYEKCMAHPLFKSSALDSVLFKACVSFCKVGGRDPVDPVFLGVEKMQKGPDGAKSPGAELLPYTLAEITDFAAGLFPANQREQVQAYFAKKYKDHDLFVSSPFVLLRKKVTTSTEGRPSLQEFYNKHIAPFLTDLRLDYFDRQSTQNFIPVYLFESSGEEDADKKFSTYCEGLHFRSSGARQSYYHKIDNSIVVHVRDEKPNFMHELVHALLAADFPEAPAWLAEGISSLYGWTGAAGPLNNYQMIYMQEVMKRYGCAVPIDQLLFLPFQEMEESFSSGIYRASTRYFCLFLNEKQLLSKVYRDIRDEKKRPRQAIEFAFSRPLHKVQLEWHVWIEELSSPEDFNEEKQLIHDFVQGLSENQWKCAAKEE